MHCTVKAYKPLYLLYYMYTSKTICYLSTEMCLAWHIYCRAFHAGQCRTDLIHMKSVG